MLVYASFTNMKQIFKKLRKKQKFSCMNDLLSTINNDFEHNKINFEALAFQTENANISTIKLVIYVSSIV